MMDYIYSLKGFINKDELIKYNYCNIIFSTIPFSLAVNFNVSDIHEIHCTTKTTYSEDIKLKDRDISLISGEMKLSFILSDYKSNEAKLISTSENFIFQIDCSVKNILIQLTPLHISFTVKKNTIIGKVIAINIKNNQYENNITAKSNNQEILKSLFL